MNRESKRYDAAHGNVKQQAVAFEQQDFVAFQINLFERWKIHLTSVLQQESSAILVVNTTLENAVEQQRVLKQALMPLAVGASINFNMQALRAACLSLCMVSSAHGPSAAVAGGCQGLPSR